MVTPSPCLHACTVRRAPWPMGARVPAWPWRQPAAAHGSTCRARTTAAVAHGPRPTAVARRRRHLTRRRPSSCALPVRQTLPRRSWHRSSSRAGRRASGGRWTRARWPACGWPRPILSGTRSPATTLHRWPRLHVTHVRGPGQRPARGRRPARARPALGHWAVPGRAATGQRCAAVSSCQRSSVGEHRTAGGARRRPGRVWPAIRCSSTAARVHVGLAPLADPAGGSSCNASGGCALAQTLQARATSNGTATRT